MQRLDDTLEAARSALLARRTACGSFAGELSSSALSTATASMALAMVDAEHVLALAGWRWMCAHQNDDGGWGDTIESPTNISTTMLCWASLGLAASPSEEIRDSLARAEAWLTRECGDLRPERLATTIRERYGADQTFSVPILTTCAIGGRLGEDGWRFVPQLPFEFAACPASWFRALNLRVVSYALPALIAIGQVRHHHRPTWNPIARCARALTRRSTLRALRSIQPSTGGYLEAAPLTSFVAMSLISMGLETHPAVEHGLRFLIETVREDGSWPIDTNLDTWTTTLAVQALGGLEDPSCDVTGGWLLGQQLADVHAYTRADPGGWAWTDRSGGVPDADDTAGALLALRCLGGDAGAASRGIGWLLDLRNRDGGMPTFCRGWGKLPFDRSGPDLTAHALRAFAAWRDDLPRALRDRVDRSTRVMVDYLLGEQRADGAWIPLWFGNQHEPAQENPIFGTSRVLRAVARVRCFAREDDWLAAGRRGVAYLLHCQQSDGGFGARPSVEETAAGVEALAAWMLERDTESAEVRSAVDRGVEWLIEATVGGTRFDAAPIGLYFARLWYSEELYPMIFSVSALALARRCRNQEEVVCPNR
jgi:squalene-hopene/tetraprenyl-beta-curcumene cyclase